MSYSWNTRGRHAALGTVLAAVAAVTLLAPSVAFAEKLVSNDGSFVVYTPPEEWQYGDHYSHPVILYLHGANHRDETEYEPLLEDMAAWGLGAYVIFPCYDATNPAHSGNFLVRALFQSIDALSEVNGLLAQHEYEPIDTENITIAGHSWGGAYALVLANIFSSASIATPEAIVLHDPAGYQPEAFPAGQHQSWLSDLSDVPSNTHLTIIVAFNTFLPEYESLANDHAGRGRSPVSGVWTSAWRNTNITVEEKDAVMVLGPHQGMLKDYYESFGQSYLDITCSAANGGSMSGFDWFFDDHLPQ
jgi:pimeloyl-ACP methyl ester carboxylesterase